MKRIALLILIWLLLTSCASKRTKIEQHTTTAKDSIRTETATITASEVITQMTATFTGGEPLIIETPKGRTKISGSGNVIIEQTSTNTDVASEVQERVQIQTVYKDRIKTVEKRSPFRWWWLLVAFALGYFIAKLK